MLEDTKWVIGSRKSKTDIQYNDQSKTRQKDKQSIKHYTVNYRSGNMNPTRSRG